MTTVVATPDSDRSQARIAIRLAPGWPALLLPTDSVPQVAIAPMIAPVPNCARWFCGVMPRRGSMVPVFDVAAAFASPADPVADVGHVVVLDQGATTLALRCSDVPHVVRGTPDPDHLPDTAGLPIAMRGYLSRPLRVDDAVMHEFDIRRWLADIVPQLGR